MFEPVAVAALFGIAVLLAGKRYRDNRPLALLTAIFIADIALKSLVSGGSSRYFSSDILTAILLAVFGCRSFKSAKLRLALIGALSAICVIKLGAVNPYGVYPRTLGTRIAADAPRYRRPLIFSYEKHAKLIGHYAGIEFLTSELPGMPRDEATLLRDLRIASASGNYDVIYVLAQAEDVPVSSPRFEEVARSYVTRNKRKTCYAFKYLPEPGAPPASGQNLLANGDFESGSAPASRLELLRSQGVLFPATGGRTELPDGWNVDILYETGYSPALDFSTVEDGAISGRKSLLAASSIPLWFYNSRALTFDESGYILSFDARGVQETRLDVYLHIYSSGDNKIIGRKKVAAIRFYPDTGSHFNIPVFRGDIPGGAYCRVAFAVKGKVILDNVEFSASADGSDRQEIREDK